MYRFEALMDLPLRHGITTREGGVSEGPYGEMNTGFSGGDDFKKVCENVRLAIDSLQMTAKTIVATHQVHGTKVLEIDEDTDFNQFETIPTVGTALESYRVYRAKDTDALTTRRNDVILMTFYADCVPIVFYDCDQHRVVTAHSGWKGTAQRFSELIANTMGPNTFACVGHSAGRCCYEVDDNVLSVFEQKFSKDECDKIFVPKGNGKYMLDLKEANTMLLVNGGIAENRISVDPACTMCQPDKYHSHRRAQGGARGSMSVFVQLL